MSILKSTRFNRVKIMLEVQMKTVLKFVFVSMLIFSVAIGLFANGNVESESPEEKIVLTLAVESDWDYDKSDVVSWYYQDFICKEFTEKTGVEVSIIPTKTMLNTTEQLERMINGGLIPSVYADYAGRVGLFANSKKLALPLNKYLSESFISQYYPSFIEMFSDKGDLYALPLTGWVQGGHVNLTALDKVGMGGVLDKGYITYDDVYVAAKKLKAIDPEYYATAVFANQAGGDYWMYVFWLSGHGAQIYNEDGTVGLNSPEGFAALSLMKKWYDEGLIPFGAAGLGPGDFIGSIGTGKLVSWAFGVGGRDRIVEYDNGDTYEWVDLHTTAPRVEGIEKVPLATGPDAVLAFNTGTEAEKKAAVELVAHIASAKYQQQRVNEDNRYPSMFSVEIPADNPNFAIMNKQLAENGTFDHGVGTPTHAEMRELWISMIQAILTDEATVEDALANFEKQGNIAIYRARE